MVMELSLRIPPPAGEEELELMKLFCSMRVAVCSVGILATPPPPSRAKLFLTEQFTSVSRSRLRIPPPEDAGALPLAMETPLMVTNLWENVESLMEKTRVV